MQPQEIRINNFVQNDGKVVRVSSTTLIHIATENTRYEPIKLNDELLSVTQFKIHDFTSDKGFFTVESGMLSFGSFYDVYWKGHHIATIRYLHQLQNLFYDLTHKEVTFKTKSGFPPRLTAKSQRPTSRRSSITTKP